MNRKLKALGLALFATMALGAIAAQGAMAAEEKFHSETETTYITGVQDNSEGIKNHFVLDGRAEPKPIETLTCKSAVFDGHTTEKTVNKVIMTPTYSECETGTGAEVVVTHNECNYTLFAELSGGHAPVDIVCGANPITIHAPAGCTITVGSQEEVTQGAVYDNEGTGNTRDIRATITAHGIHWSTDNSFICTLGGMGADSGTDATYISQVTVKGYENAEHTKQVGVWWE